MTAIGGASDIDRPATSDDDQPRSDVRLRSQVVTLRALPMRCWLTVLWTACSAGTAGPWIAIRHPRAATYSARRPVELTVEALGTARRAGATGVVGARETSPGLGLTGHCSPR
jgi:hypothetical protein